MIHINSPSRSPVSISLITCTFMKLSFSTRTKRHTAFLVLLGWLFALASGVANACLLEARITHAHAAPVESSETAQTRLVSPGHVGVVAGHDGDSDPSKPSCLKVCDDSAHSLPKQDLKATQADPGPAPLMSVLWTAVTPAAPTSRRMDHVLPTLAERPIRVRYARLAL